MPVTLSCQIDSMLPCSCSVNITDDIKCDKNKKGANEAQPFVSLMFIPHFDTSFDQLLNRPMIT